MACFKMSWWAGEKAGEDSLKRTDLQRKESAVIGVDLWQGEMFSPVHTCPSAFLFFGAAPRISFQWMNELEQMECLWQLFDSSWSLAI